jgi:hypothetical protein
MGRGLKRLVLVFGLVCLLGGATLATAPSSTAAALSYFYLYVKDEKAVPRPDAWVVIRYRFGPHIWQRVAAGKTEADGCVVFQLDPAEDYVVLVYYNDAGMEETWAYGYIGKQDWGGAEKTFFRNRPWVNEVDMGTSPWIVGESQDITLKIAHGYRDTDYDFEVKVAMTVDDDGEAPYLSDLTSDTQVFYTGIQPFHFAYTPTSEGRFLVRFVIYTKFEANDWEISDNGDWHWQIDAIKKTDAPASVRGQVYQDMNHDQAYTPGEPPVRGVQLVLAQGSVVVGETATNDQGRYEFSIPAGSYQLSIRHAPYGYQVPGKQDMTCAAGQVQSLDWALEKWYCFVPTLLASYKP